MEHTPDSQRAWELLISRIERLEQALDKAELDDTNAWREYRAKSETQDTALTILRSEIAALRLRVETAELRVRLKSVTPIWQKVAWTLAAGGVAMILTRLGIDIPSTVTLLVKWLGGN
jgi:hypothetical protein